MLTLTDNAVKKLQNLFASTPEAQGKSLRIFVKAGGCCGYEYGFVFDEKKADDTEVTADGIRVLVDPASAGFLGDSTVDYADGLTDAGFRIMNPNEKGSCSCGQSHMF